MTASVVSVGLLTAYLRQLIENDPILADIWIEGEVSSVFTSRSGHVYFTLSEPEAQLKCVLFRGYAQRQRLLPAPGDQIAAHGRISIYERDGTYQLTADVIEHAGQGLMALQFERLRQRLESEGLFDVARKRPLPQMPRCIGVVTSAEGAVWHDILTVLRRRYPLAHVILSPAPVQGAAAPDGIVAALARLQRDGRAELAIVARGGGSTEDLACFNDERVARAVFACRIPVVSAIGHETDWTIIDFVADLRAPTPSAAAELCAPSIEALAEECDQLHSDIRQAWLARIAAESLLVTGVEWRLGVRSPAQRLRELRMDLSRLQHALGLVGALLLPAFRLTADSAFEALVRCRVTPTAERRTVVDGLTSVLEALDPARVLVRGYAMIQTDDTKRLVTSVSDVGPGCRVSAQLKDGSFHATVVSSEPGRGAGDHVRT